MRASSWQSCRGRKEVEERGKKERGGEHQQLAVLQG